MNPVRQHVNSLDSEFAQTHKTSYDFISGLCAELLYTQPRESTSKETCGELILRSAAVIEQSFGGLAANLWDDPFEWTLPETLNTPAKVVEYLTEVEATRICAFTAFRDDTDLSKEIMTPAGTTQILPFLLDTLNRARHHQQRAFKVIEALSL